MTRRASHSPRVGMVAGDRLPLLESDKPPSTRHNTYYRSFLGTSLTSLDERIARLVHSRRLHARATPGGCRGSSPHPHTNLECCWSALRRPRSANADLQQLSGQVCDVAERRGEFGYACVRLLELGSGHEQIGLHVSARLDLLVQSLLGLHGPRMHRGQQVDQLSWVGHDSAIDDEDPFLGSLKECGPRSVNSRLRHALSHRVFGQQMTGVHGWHGTAGGPETLVTPQWCRSTIDSSMAQICWNETEPTRQGDVIAGQTLVSHSLHMRLKGLGSPCRDGQTDPGSGVGLMFATATHPSETGSGTLLAVGRRYTRPAAGLARPARETNQMPRGEMRQAATRRHNNPDQVDHPKVVQTGGRQASGKAKTARPEFLAEQGYMRFH